jgi:hypothetical protein
LKAVLPLLVIVWTSLPSLPCCQGLPMQRAADHVGHSAHESSTAAAASGAHAVAAHMHHGSVLIPAGNPTPGSDPDPPDADSDAPEPFCGDVVKNHTEARSSAAPAAAIVLATPTLVLPALFSVVESVGPADEPPRILKRRPLHLAKSVLLI